MFFFDLCKLKSKLIFTLLILFLKDLIQNWFFENDKFILFVNSFRLFL